MVKRNSDEDIKKLREQLGSVVQILAIQKEAIKTLSLVISQQGVVLDQWQKDTEKWQKDATTKIEDIQKKVTKP